MANAQVAGCGTMPSRVGRVAAPQGEESPDFIGHGAQSSTGNRASWGGATRRKVQQKQTAYGQG